MNILVFVIAVLFSLIAQAESQTRIGLFYEIGTKSEKYLFKQETKVDIADDLNRKTDSTIWDYDGKVLMRETAMIKDGVVVEQTMEQLQISEKYVLTVKDGNVKNETLTA